MDASDVELAPLTSTLTQNWGALIAILPGDGPMTIQEPYAQMDIATSVLDYLDLSSQIGAGSLMGLAFDDQGRLHAVDFNGNRILRIAPLAEVMP